MFVALVLAGSLSACTSEPVPQPGASPRGTATDPATRLPTQTLTSSTSPRAPVVKVPPKSCPDVTGARYATGGPLRMGPFSKDTLSNPTGTGDIRKVWASSQRKGDGDAVLVVTDPTGRQTKQTRPGGVAFIDSAPQFFPGAIQVRKSGPYRLHLKIDDDTMCVVVDYTA